MYIFRGGKITRAKGFQRRAEHREGRKRVGVTWSAVVRRDEVRGEKFRTRYSPTFHASVYSFEGQ